MSKDNHSELASHLHRIEDLWQKLIYVKWSQESFNLLAVLAHEMRRIARSHNDEQLTDLATQLENYLKDCIAAKRIPQAAERQRVTALLRQLRDDVSAAQAAQQVNTTKPMVASASEVFVIAAGNTWQLIAKLKDAGFRVRHLATLSEAEAAFAETLPAVVIVDVDFPDEPLAGIGLIAEMRALTSITAPVFFIAERDDITARLEAVRAGGKGYFNKQLDVPALLEKLQNCLVQQSIKGQERVLIVDDTPSEAREIASILESRGIMTRVVHQPMQVIQGIYRFQPDLLLLDLELKEISGVELTKVLSQHTACEVLPLILLASQSYQARNLSKLEAAGASLLSKPVAPDYLCWLVIQQLSRSRALRSKLNALNERDSVSGLYNRRYFLAQLERSIAAIGASACSVAVMSVMLDNLRAIRDATDVISADKVVEQAAARLRKVLGRQYSAARFSDAVFTVLMNDVHQEALLKAAHAIRDALETGAYEVGLQALLLRVSIGISIATDEKQNFLTLIQQADRACSLAREAKGEHVYLYHELTVSRDEEEFQRQRLLAQIEESLRRQRMKLLFQPIISLRGDQTQRYEVLLRISNDEGHELLPETVFGILQRHPLGVALDRWVIAQSIELLAQRISKAPATTLFIKILPITLQDESLRGWLETLLQGVGVNPERLVFQVACASAERDLRELLGFLNAVKALGCGFCLDHFTHSEEALALLRNVAADYVKLDRIFVHGLVSDEAKQQQLKELVESLEIAGVPAIVGGIEDMQTLPMLWSYGIDYVQGFFLQRPHEEMSYDFSSAAASSGDLG